MTLNLGGKTVYDLGGYQGRMTICFARAVGNNGRVITFEPNPTNYPRILENIALNGFKNVEVHQLGVGSEKASFELRFDEKDTARSSFRENYFENRNLKADKSLLIEVDSLDSLIIQHALPKPDFIKMDVEELEFEVLTGMPETIKNYKPQLLIEMHGGPNNVSRVVNLLLSYGYSIRHIELDETIDAANTEKLRGGQHIYCC
jgi:FkbM family methyltransferase